MGVFGLLSWAIGFVFSFVFERLDDVFVWVLPSYMTVQVMKDESRAAQFKNFLCFWVILSVLLALEYSLLYLFYSMTLYRVARLLLIMWLQMDSCSNAHTALAFIQPFISKEHENRFSSVLDLVTAEMDKYGAMVKERVSDQFWSLITQNYELVKNGLFSAITTVTNKAAGAGAGDDKENRPPQSGEAAQEAQEEVQKKES